MKILIINGACLRTNSSANLCHRAYIQGFVENEHELTVLTCSEKNKVIDTSVRLPRGPQYLFFQDTALYNFLKSEQIKKFREDEQNKKQTLQTKVVTNLKKFLLKLYGPFGYHIVWAKNVVAHFKSKEQFKK